MLKQPFSGVLQGVSSGYPARRYSCFSASNSSLLSSGYDFYNEDIVFETDDDASVSSLESFYFGDDGLDDIKASSSKPVTTTVNAGNYYEKNPSSRKPQTSNVYIQPHETPLSYHLKNAPSPIRTHKSSAGRATSNDSKPKNLHESFDSSITTDDFASSEDPQSLPYALAVATPISATKVAPCCDFCDRKDLKIQKQAQEIGQLKKLVAQLINVLAQQQPQASAPAVDTKESRESALGGQQEVKVKTSAIDTSVQPRTESKQFAVTTSDMATQVSPVPIMQGVPASALAGTAGSSGPTNTMLRLCRLKQLKEESTGETKRSYRNGKRHLYVSVGGNWGYYSGPSLEQNQPLHGCVVRFDNGDLYLGNMLCYVPTTLFFSDEHGLVFHGRGTLYHKCGSITRGLFHKHQLME